MRGRPFLKGLHFFPLMTDIASDDKIKLLIAECGKEGFAFLVLLWARMYRRDYYILWDLREKKLFCSDYGFDLADADRYINVCLDEGIFSLKSYSAHSILTSRTIQEIWIDSTQRRKKLFFVKEYLLIDINTIRNKNRVEFIDKEGDLLPEQPKKVTKPKKTATPGDKLPEETPEQPAKTFGEDQLKVFISRPYVDYPDQFKERYAESWYQSYVAFSNRLFNEFKNLLVSENQLTIADYKKVITENNISKEELDWILKKMASKGVNVTAGIYFRVLDYHQYYLEDADKPSGGTGLNGAVLKPVPRKLLFDAGANTAEN